MHDISEALLGISELADNGTERTANEFDLLLPNSTPTANAAKDAKTDVLKLQSKLTLGNQSSMDRADIGKLIDDEIDNTGNVSS